MCAPVGSLKCSWVNSIEDSRRSTTIASSSTTCAYNFYITDLFQQTNRSLDPTPMNALLMAKSQCRSMSCFHAFAAWQAPNKSEKKQKECINIIPLTACLNIKKMENIRHCYSSRNFSGALQFVNYATRAAAHTALREPATHPFGISSLSKTKQRPHGWWWSKLNFKELWLCSRWQNWTKLTWSIQLDSCVGNC